MKSQDSDLNELYFAKEREKISPKKERRSGEKLATFMRNAFYLEITAFFRKGC